MEFRLWPEIKTKNQDGALGNMSPVIPSKVRNQLRDNKTYVWYQDDISLEEHRLAGSLQFGTIEINKLKYPKMIDDKQWCNRINKDRRRLSTLHIPNKLFHWDSYRISVCIVGFSYCIFKHKKKKD